jgi:hypothetical protein
MNLTRTNWPEWKRNLQTSGFSDQTAMLLETLAPLGFIFSQLIYLTGWLFPGDDSSKTLLNISKFLEDDSEVRDFAFYLKERDHDLS